MPTLQLQVSGSLTAERRTLLARRLGALSTELLGKRQAATAVMIQELPVGSWFIAGKAVETTALLEISITQGTNSEVEKAAFVVEAYRELELQLGPLEEVSYVIVREVPAGDWGYGAMTQKERMKTVAVL